jgi:hypothetical protein
MVRRQELLQELDGINRQILEMQESIAKIEPKMGSIQDRPQLKAA